MSAVVDTSRLLAIGLHEEVVVVVQENGHHIYENE